MQYTDQFTVIPEGDYECQLCRHGEPTSVCLNGAKLQAAVTWKEFYFLVMTDENGYEDFLNLHLLDKHLSTLASASIGAPYSSGDLSRLSLMPPHQLSFCFPEAAHTWRVTLFESPHLRLPIEWGFFGVWRKFGIRKHFDIGKDRGSRIRGGHGTRD